MSNQTVSFLMKRFAEAGIHVKSRHGQNFLIDLNLQRLLADSAELGPRDVALEVGTGTGALTALIAERAAHVVTVEIDPQLYQLASEELFEFSNVTMLAQDALKNKNTLAPGVIEAVKLRLAEQPGRRLKLVANLPYSVATPVITNLLASEIPPATMTVTIQKELADRMSAVPGTKDYSALSIWVQSLCRVRIVRILPPTVFWPRPKVTSAIIHLEAVPELRAKIPDLVFWQEFVRSMFFHRRKYLRRVLETACGGALSKPEVDAILAEQHLAADNRAERLDVETMLALGEAVRRRINTREPLVHEHASAPQD